MGVYKGINVYTKLDGNAAGYLDAIDKELGGIDEIHDASKQDWAYDNSISKEDVLKMLARGDSRVELHVATSHSAFYLNLYQKDGVPSIGMIDDFAQDANRMTGRLYSYEELFQQYFDFAKNRGNSVCDMSSENFEDAQLRTIAYDKDGREISDRDTARAFAKKELGLSYLYSGLRVPEVYAEAVLEDKIIDKPVVFGKTTENNIDYFLGYEKDGQYHAAARVSIPIDIPVGANFEKELKSFVKDLAVQEQLQDLGKTTARFLCDTDMSRRADERERLRGLILTLRDKAQKIYDKAILEAGKDIEAEIPFDVTEKKTPYMTLAEAETDWKKWLNLKNTTLNGKDAAVLMADAPWRTKEELLAEKKRFVSFVPEKGSKEAVVMQRGLELQNEAKSRFIQETKMELEEGAIYRSETKPFMIARIQFQDKEGNPVQIMTTGVENVGLWEKTAPPNVYDEAQWNMAVTGAKTAHVGCLIDAQNDKGEPELSLVTRTFNRDDRYIAQMTKAAERFQKELDSKFLSVFVPKGNIELKGEAYYVKTPDDSLLQGDTVVIPQRLVHYDKQKESYRLSLPIKNMKGKSFLFKREGNDKAKSASAAEIYCAANRVRGKALFMSNRTLFTKKKTNTEEIDKTR